MKIHVSRCAMYMLKYYHQLLVRTYPPAMESSLSGERRWEGGGDY